MINCLDSTYALTRRELQKSDQNVYVAMTDVQIQESRTAINQAEIVKRVTELAFVFIISVTGSAFGMNIQELAYSPPSVWVSLLVMLGVTLTTILCSLECTYNIFGSIRKLLKTVTPKELTSWARIRLYKEKVDGDPVREGWPRLKLLPWPIRQLILAARLLYDSCRIPLALVQRLCGV